MKNPEKYAVRVSRLVRTYRVPVREKGLKNALTHLFRRQYDEVQAVKGIDFTLQKGEIVGFIGPNGAGKTTTLKILSGILYPTGGTVSVLGFTPSRRQPAFLRRISLVLGNKSQLNWDIPVADSLYVLKEIYRVSTREYNYRFDELRETLAIDDLLKKQARNLSLGERGKCEIAAALLHRPDVLFLDEPTLGLDVSMQISIREFLKNYNRKYATTILLTSHYMEDIKSLCDRVILIDKGEIGFDGQLAVLGARLAPYKLIKLSFRNVRADNDALRRIASEPGVDIISQDRSKAEIRVTEEKVKQAATYCMSLPVDLTIENPPIEAIIDQLYQRGSHDV